MKKTKTTKKETANNVQNATTQTQPQTLTSRALKLAQLREISKKALLEKEKFIECEENKVKKQKLEEHPINFYILNGVYGGLYQTFKTFDEWKKEGASINKGEKAYLIWGKPIRYKQPNGEIFRFFPILHVFSNRQVTHKDKPQPTQAMPF